MAARLSIMTVNLHQADKLGMTRRTARGAAVVVFPALFERKRLEMSALELENLGSG